MVAFSKFLTGRRGSRQLLDTDGYTYNERKERTTAEGLSTWRCSKNRSKKCPCVVYFCSSDESLNTGPREHNHPAESLVEEKKTLIASLKRKAADQQLSSTQNILTETLATSTPDLNVNLPKLESLARAAQRSRSKSSGTNHPASSKSLQTIILTAWPLYNYHYNMDIQIDFNTPALYDDPAYDTDDLDTSSSSCSSSSSSSSTTPSSSDAPNPTSISLPKERLLDAEELFTMMLEDVHLYRTRDPILTGVSAVRQLIDRVDMCFRFMEGSDFLDESKFKTLQLIRKRLSEIHGNLSDDTLDQFWEDESSSTFDEWLHCSTGIPFRDPVKPIIGSGNDSVVLKRMIADKIKHIQKMGPLECGQEGVWRLVERIEMCDRYLRDGDEESAQYRF
ncbi:hypothetical protein ACHWQZ_G018341 [Mnemiopsis leidyi]